MRSFGMKKRFAVVLVCVMAALSACCAEEEPVPVFEDIFPPRSGAQVAAVFAASDIQPFVKSGGNQENLDSVWVYYTGGTFEQYAITDDPDIVVRFSENRYQPGEGSPVPYDSVHKYELGTLGLIRIVAFDD